MLVRMTVNAPGQGHPMRQYHGMRVLASRSMSLPSNKGGYKVWHQVYFTSGSTICTFMQAKHLSYGWNPMQKEQEVCHP